METTPQGYLGLVFFFDGAPRSGEEPLLAITRPREPPGQVGVMLTPVPPDVLYHRSPGQQGSAVGLP